MKVVISIEKVNQPHTINLFQLLTDSQMEIWRSSHLWYIKCITTGDHQTHQQGLHILQVKFHYTFYGGILNNCYSKLLFGYYSHFFAHTPQGYLMFQYCLLEANCFCSTRSTATLIVSDKLKSKSGVTDCAIKESLKMY